jgi:GTPase SAR1 family protein
MYLRGAVGCLVIADSTRKETLDTAKTWKSIIEEHSIEVTNEFMPTSSALSSGGTKSTKETQKMPIFLLVNKADLHDQNEISEQMMQDTIRKCKFSGGFFVSARTGDKLEHAFEHLTEQVLNFTEKMRREGRESLNSNGLRLSTRGIPFSEVTNHYSPITTKEYSRPKKNCC